MSTNDKCTKCGGNDHNADECKRFAGEREATAACPYRIDGDKGQAFIHAFKEGWQARTAQPAPAVPEGWRAGVEAVAALIEKKVDDYAADFGHIDLGHLSFGIGPKSDIRRDHHSSLVELAEEVRALAAAPAQGQQVECQGCERLRDQYQRDVYGLNNEGDPIGGEPAGGYANDNARLRAELAALKAQQAEQKPAAEFEPDSVSEEPDGCPTELAVLKRFWRDYRDRQLSGPVVEAMKWAEHLLFECGALTSTRAPSVHVYNKTFEAVNAAKALLTTPQPAPAQDVEDWSIFPGYLIDKCEGQVVAEENLQWWLAEMLADPHYGALFRREKQLAEQPSALELSIEAAEEEHGSLRSAAKALGIDPGYLSRLKNGEKTNPSDEVLAALGLERVVLYRAAAHEKQSGGEV
jgi:hypothetical protein